MKMISATTLRNAAFLVALSPVAACAQPVGQTHSPTSKTGVTRQQFASRHENKILAADVDGDGKVSQSEFVDAAKAGKRDPAKRFAKLDRNGDGKLDKAEIDAMLTRRFAKVDTNGDGIASGEERAAAHAKKRKVTGNGSDL